MARDTLTLVDLACWGLQLLVEWSRAERRPIVSVTLNRCPRQGGRVLRVWRWYAESGH